MKAKSALLLLLATLLLPSIMQAQWTPDGAPICTAVGDQYKTTIVSDGAGGAIITWQEYRNGIADVYAQRVDAGGNAKWAANGVVICTATSYQWDPTIASDGAGGAIITWYDYRSGNFDIYAQRVDADGAVRWTANGVAVCTATGHQLYPNIVPDGAGGAVIAWYDERGGTYDIYAQKINASGTVQWAANGVVICAAIYEEFYPTLVSDGLGGAIIAWQDIRGAASWDIFAQGINAIGAVKWTANGVAICTVDGDQNLPTIVSDGFGGAIITWFDARSGSNTDIYAQRINASGAIEWTANGMAICTATGDQKYPAIASDGLGGAIITWYDYRSGTNYDIYAQGINAFGDVQWTGDGAAICTADTDQTFPTIASDGLGGAIITWYDYRNGTNYDIYAQGINAFGNVQWTADGAAICTTAGSQQNAKIISDGSGGAIITWPDYRSGTNWDIYAQRVDAAGTPGGVEGSVNCNLQISNFKLEQNRPNPFNQRTTIKYQIPKSGMVNLQIYNIAGQLMRRLIDGEKKMGSYEVVWNGNDERGKQVPAGVYLIRYQAGNFSQTSKAILLR